MLPTHLPATGQSAIMLTQNCFPVESNWHIFLTFFHPIGLWRIMY
jgi:hypothetical protein